MKRELFQVTDSPAKVDAYDLLPGSTHRWTWEVRPGPCQLGCWAGRECFVLPGGRWQPPRGCPFWCRLVCWEYRKHMGHVNSPLWPAFL